MSFIVNTKFALKKNSKQMPLYREDNFLVVHPGSTHTLFLFGLQESLSPPEYRIPSVVYQNPITKTYQAEKPDSIEDVTEIYPIKGGKIIDIEGFKFLLKVILQSVIAKNPIITINQIPLLLVVPSFCWSRYQIESITKYVIESLEFTGFNVLDLSVAATFAIGNGTSACVVNIGKDATQVAAVIGCQNIKYAGKYLPLGGQDINESLKKLLPNLSEKQIEALKTSKIFEVVTDDDSFYSISDLKQTDDQLDVAKLVVEEGEVNGETKEEEELDVANNQLEKNFFLDPDTNEKIYIGKERFQGTDNLVETVAEGIFKVLDQIPDLERKQECYNNLIITGSTIKIPGFKQALVKKLYENYSIRTPSEQAAAEASGVNSAIAAYQQSDEQPDTTDTEFVIAQVPTTIKLCKNPDHFPEWKNPKESGGSWENVYFLGGEIYAKQIFGGNSNSNGELFVDSNCLEDKGPQAIWNAAI